MYNSFFSIKNEGLEVGEASGLAQWLRAPAGLAGHLRLDLPPHILTSGICSHHRQGTCRQNTHSTKYFLKEIVFYKN